MPKLLTWVIEMTGSTESLSGLIRAIAPGKKAIITGRTSNVVRATVARVLGAGNYRVKRLDGFTFEVTRLA